jgi:hypothetical protein
MGTRQGLASSGLLARASRSTIERIKKNGNTWIAARTGHAGCRRCRVYGRAWTLKETNLGSQRPGRVQESLCQIQGAERRADPLNIRAQEDGGNCPVETRCR